MKPSKYKTVAELLADPGRWTQKAWARDGAGMVDHPDADTACRWCLVGACRHVYGAGTDECREAVHAIAAEIPGILRAIDKLIAFNDDPKTVHAEVLKAARKAGV